VSVSVLRAMMVVRFCQSTAIRPHKAHAPLVATDEPMAMTAVHPLTMRNALADYVLDLLGAGASPGYGESQTAGGAQVATVALSNLRSIPPIAGVRAAKPMLGDYNATGGTIAEGRSQRRQRQRSPHLLGHHARWRWVARSDWLPAIHP
jgi:hypothetical protein